MGLGQGVLNIQAWHRAMTSNNRGLNFHVFNTRLNVNVQVNLQGEGGVWCFCTNDKISIFIPEMGKRARF